MSNIEILCGEDFTAAGWKVKIESNKKFKPVNFKTTSGHEATHVVAGIKNGSNVVRASRIPGPGYNGITQLDRFDPVAAMAAHAMGCNGTGYDRSIVAYSGHDTSTAAWRAQCLLSHSMDEVSAVAGLLEEKGIISGADAVEAMADAKNDNLKISLINPEGERRIYTQKVRKALQYYIPIEVHITPIAPRNDKRVEEKSLEDIFKNTIDYTISLHPLVDKVHSPL